MKVRQKEEREKKKMLQFDLKWWIVSPYSDEFQRDHRSCERKNVNIFLSISKNICFGCSKELSHWDGSFEYPQHMFWLRNKKKYFSIMHSYLKAWIQICLKVLFFLIAQPNLMLWVLKGTVSVMIGFFWVPTTYFEK